MLASIVASSGSTPRGAGSRMLVGKKGRVAGTIGGGSVEYRAELMALDILEKKKALVIADEGFHILALVGHRIDDSVKVTKATATVTVIRLI